MAKIKVKTPVVELDGDEMTRIIWGFIKDKLILPYLDIDLKYYDLGIEHRDATDDQVTVDSALAIKQYGVGVKCATITPDEARVKEFSLRRMYRSPNGTIRNILDGTIFREPIICANVPRLVPHWTKPIVIGRHAYGDIYRAAETKIPGPGKVTLLYEPANGGEELRFEVHDFKGPGVALAIHNTKASIEGFARASFNYGLCAIIPSISQPKTRFSKPMTACSRDVFQDVFDTEFKPQVRGARPDLRTPPHRRPGRLCALKSDPAAIVWACKNYDGDVQIGRRRPGVRLARTHDLRPYHPRRKDRRNRSRPRHCHPPLPRTPEAAGKPPPTRSPPSSPGLPRTALPRPVRQDAGRDTVRRDAGAGVRETVESGAMTKDLAILVGPEQPYMNTQSFLAKIDENLQTAMK